MFINSISSIYNLHKLRKNQWRSYLELERLQLNKLQDLVQYAYYNVNYYRELFDQAGIKPEEIKNRQDILKIPITSKRKLQALPKKDIVSKNVYLNRCLRLRTSGSTGMPLETLLSTREGISKSLFYRRMYAENGSRLNDRTVKITNPQNFRSKKWFEYIGLFEEKYISIFDDTEKQIKVILEFDPQVIYGYASALKNLAIEIIKRKLNKIKPRIIFSSAEQMTEEDRKFISSVFQVNVIDYYSSIECGLIAWECRQHAGYHIDSDNVIVEFIKEDGTYAQAGEEGEIVVTSLNSFTMPFIRYKLGDIGVASDEKCPCGRTLPLIKKIIGRSNDCFILPNGKKVYPFFLMRALRDIPGISQYQMIQQRKDKVRINLVKSDSFSSGTVFAIQESSKGILGNDVEIEINIVETIPISKNGKFQAIKSELK